MSKIAGSMFDIDKVNFLLIFHWGEFCRAAMGDGWPVDYFNLARIAADRTWGRGGRGGSTGWQKKTDLESYMQLLNFQVEGSGEEDVSSDEKWVRVKIWLRVEYLRFKVYAFKRSGLGWLWFKYLVRVLICLWLRYLPGWGEGSKDKGGRRRIQGIKFELHFL